MNLIKPVVNEYYAKKSGKEAAIKGELTMKQIKKEEDGKVITLFILYYRKSFTEINLNRFLMSL